MAARPGGGTAAEAPPGGSSAGRLPLALSARCFTARHLHLQKDVCDFRCVDHPDGLTLRSREGDLFDGVMNRGDAVDSALPEQAALRLPGALADGYAHARRAGMTWSASA